MEGLDTGPGGAGDRGMAGTDQLPDGGAAGAAREAGDHGQAAGPTGTARLSRASLMQVHPENCADDSITAHPNSHVNVNRFTMPKDPVSIIIATALALSI